MDSSYAIPPAVYHYRGLSRWTLALRIALWADVILSAAALVLPLVGPAVPAPLVAIVSSFRSLAFVVSSILVLVWFYRATANVISLGADITFDPPWAVGWLLIPIVSTWMAFVVVEEVWRASIGGERWRDHHVPWLAIYWWAAWAIACVAGALTRFMPGMALIVLYFAAHLAYAYLLLPIISRIGELQESQATSRGFA